ncbi:MAG: hypothetical protein FJY29_05760 [Betaproteobacteria bacterium]|nr:hypothetical protein [Betaproteobacteria bacterium]
MRRNLTKSMRESSFMLLLGSTATTLLLSCQPGRKFYVLEEIRVPAMQILQKFDSVQAGRHCFELSGETVCQQYPLRPEGKYYFRMLGLAPAGSQPLAIKFTRLQRAQLVQKSPTEDIRAAFTRIQSDPNLTETQCLEELEKAISVQFVDTPFELFGFPTDALAASVKQENPMRIEEHVVSFTTPPRTTLDGDVLSTGKLPLFKVDYTATSGNLRADNGALTFAVVAEAQQGGGGSNGASFSKCLSGFFLGNASSATNTAPYVTAITPTRGSEVGGSPQELRLELAGLETAAGSKQRVQWYLSRGELSNQRAASSELTFSGSEALTAVGIVRDLQGGVDFAWTTFTAKP